MLKTKAKLLIALGIMLLAVCVFNMNTVNAATQEELQAMLDVIPNEITLDITELEYEKADDIIKQKVETILKDEELSTEGMNISVYGTKLYYLDIHTATISIGSKTKEVSVSYSNSNQRNSADEQAVKNMKIESPKYYEVSLELARNGDNFEGSLNTMMNYYSKLSTDNSIKIIADSAQGGADGYFNMSMQVDVGIFKNGILYDIRPMGWEATAPVINVPSTVADSEINNYIINAIKEYYPDYASKITGIEKGAKYEPYSNISNIYTITSNIADTELNESYVIVKTTPKITLDNKETNIKLETAEGVIPSNTVLEVAPITEGATFDTVKKALSNIKNFKVFDINLLSNGVKIQPNGKVKISIPVPTEFNKSNLVVYRVADNGEKTEYTVTVDGDVATFETDHFSTYVLAEKEITENTSNTTDRKKDDTPKTGTTASIYFIIPVAVISAIGIIAFRRKETI